MDKTGKEKGKGDVPLPVTSVREGFAPLRKGCGLSGHADDVLGKGLQVNLAPVAFFYTG